MYGWLKKIYREKYLVGKVEIPNIDYHYVAEAYTFGQIYRLGQYPGLIATNDQSQKVYGEVYHIKNSTDWQALDIFENSAPLIKENPEYERKIISVHTKERSIKAYAYLYLGDVIGDQLIRSGKF